MIFVLDPLKIIQFNPLWLKSYVRMQIENNDDIWKYQTNLFRKEILLRHLFHYLHFKLGFCSYDYWYAKNWMMQTKQDSINGSLLKKFIVVYLNTPSRSLQFLADKIILKWNMIWNNYYSKWFKDISKAQNSFTSYRLEIVIQI